jgi:hypothetical protein
VKDADRYEQLRTELVGLLETDELTDSDRESLCQLARTDDWSSSNAWSYAKGHVMSVLNVIDSAGREGLDDETLEVSVVADLKAVLEQQTCGPRAATQ